MLAHSEMADPQELMGTLILLIAAEHLGRARFAR